MKNRIFDSFAAYCLQNNNKNVEMLLTQFEKEHPDLRNFIINNAILFLEVGKSARKYKEKREA